MNDEPENEPPQIIIYETDDKVTRVSVRLEDESVWLTNAQLAQLFQVSKSTVSEHIIKGFTMDDARKDLGDGGYGFKSHGQDEYATSGGRGCPCQRGTGFPTRGSTDRKIRSALLYLQKRSVGVPPARIWDGSAILSHNQPQTGMSAPPSITALEAKIDRRVRDLYRHPNRS